MSRLIDLDQTIFIPIVDESKGGVKYELQMTVGEMFDKFLDGFTPEVVDAIPVEWLETQINEALDDNETELASDIGWLIRKYINEQEARQ